MKVLVSGVAGFIGSEVALRLLDEGHSVFGFDNLTTTGDPELAQSRLDRFESVPNFEFKKMDLLHRSVLSDYFRKVRPDVVVHLAAQAGVRMSLEVPHQYIDSNVTGFLNLLECCRHRTPEHLVFASSSSVYGLNGSAALSPHQVADHPVSLYAATKKVDELLAHTYSRLFGIPVTGLRFFTVYGPWGRPDMAPFKFTRKILAGEPIEIYNSGNHRRDFTYVDDIVDGIYRVATREPPNPDENWDATNPDPATSAAPYRIYNIGSGHPIELLDFVALLEKVLDRRAERCLVEAQGGDVLATCADISDLARDYGYAPRTSFETGITRFVEWYRDYYHA